MNIQSGWLSALVRPNILSLVPYSSARMEFTGEAQVFLDANESYRTFVGMAEINRYPDPSSQELIGEYSSYLGIKKHNIMVGSGSDELIDVLMRVFCRPGIDRIVTLAPSYGAYEVFAGINDLAVDHIQLQPDFTLPVDAAVAFLRRAGAASSPAGQAKLLFLCSPNNPTGNAFPLETISACAEAFEGITIVDEAYIDFSAEPSAVSLLETHPRLVVMRTLSKAWALAGARVGFMMAHEDIVRIARTVAYPYNVGTPSQVLALQALRSRALVADAVKEIVVERQRLGAELEKLSCIEHVFPSDANFLLVRTGDAQAVMMYLRSKGIIIRNRTREPGCENCIRITVGSQLENNAVLAALKEYGDLTPISQIKKEKIR